jgi:zinc protease
MPLLEARFADWKAPDSKLALPAIATVELPAAPQVYLVDQPGATQANIFVGQVVPSTTDAKALEFDIANGVLGGEFSSRLNMKLREEKQWAYGAYSFTQGALGQRPWIAFAPVQIDKTVESIGELKAVIEGFASGSAAIDQVEADKIKLNNVRSLPGAYETAGSVMGQIGSILRYNRPDNYVEVYKQRTESMPLEAVRDAAASIKPGALTWVVVGELAKIEQPIRELKLGEVHVMDADGKKLR